MQSVNNFGIFLSTFNTIKRTHCFFNACLLWLCHRFVCSVSYRTSEEEAMLSDLDVGCEYRRASEYTLHSL